MHIILLALILLTTMPALAADCPQLTVCFTPGQDCTQAIVSAIAGATQQIRAQAYSFTSAPIAKALAAAHTRGVDVQVILDKSQRSEKYSSADFIANHGIPVFLDYAHAIAHNKLLIIDGERVVTGSFNFSAAAQSRNAENLVLLSSPTVAAEYLRNWDMHRRHSVAYVGRGVTK